MYPNCGSQTRRWRLAWLVVPFSLNMSVLRLYYSPEPKTLLGDEGYYFNLAQSIAAGQPAVHHPFWPPLYAELMGWLFGVVGNDVLVIQSVQIVLWLVSGLLFAQIGATVFQSRLVGTTTFALFVLHPELMAFSHFLWPEIPHLFFFGAGLWLLIHWPQHAASAVLAGVCLGLALLTKLLLLPFLPLLGVWIYGQTAGSWSRRFAQVLLIAGPLCLTLVPTMHRNAQLHGRWMVADSSVFNVWVGLNDRARRDYEHGIAGQEFEQFEASRASFIERDQLYWNKIQDFIQHQGVLQTLWGQARKQYFRLFHAETYFTSQLPGGPRQAYQFAEFPLTPVLRAYTYVMHALVLGLGVLGLCLVRLRAFGWPQLLLAFVGYNLGLFLFVHVKTRYLVQFLPMLMMFVGVVVDRLVRLWRGEQDVIWSMPRVLIGGILVVLVEYLAFGP